MAYQTSAISNIHAPVANNVRSPRQEKRIIMDDSNIDDQENMEEAVNSLENRSFKASHFKPISVLDITKFSVGENVSIEYLPPKEPEASSRPTNVEAWDALRSDLEAERQVFINKNVRALARKVNKWDAGELDNVYQDVFERCKKYDTAMTPQDCREQFEDRKAVILRKRTAQPGDRCSWRRWAPLNR